MTQPGEPPSSASQHSSRWICASIFARSRENFDARAAGRRPRDGTALRSDFAEPHCVPTVPDCCWPLPVPTTRAARGVAGLHTAVELDA
eukprot:4117886-Prymnesium_polylepis.1